MARVPVNIVNEGCGTQEVDGLGHVLRISDTFDQFGNEAFNILLHDGVGRLLDFWLGVPHRLESAREPGRPAGQETSRPGPRYIGVPSFSPTISGPIERLIRSTTNKQRAFPRRMKSRPSLLNMTLMLLTRNRPSLAGPRRNSQRLGSRSNFWQLNLSY